GEIGAGKFPPEAVDEAFRLFRAALAPLAEAGKLGYVLFQLAPWVRYDDARLAYLASLPARLPGWTVAVEFRHRSWLPDHAHEAPGAQRPDDEEAARAAGARRPCLARRPLRLR